MILHGYFRSSAAYRVRIALNLKGLEVEHRFVHLRRGEQGSDAYRGVNPQALVPTLEVGDRRIGQSLAIIEYLEEQKPEPSLLPKTPADRARVRSLALFIACEIQPPNNL
ncbi:MAG TPA: glutathione S-transferase N-terminal domain-containing protein, partial [Usitatibacter sp.]|nr:glutathione S-transferase N-terminal domain-containing protein [Usitatibacter sp.]